MLESFHRKYAGREAVILTCGPSLVNYSDESVRAFCSGKIVLAVKQAILKYPDLDNTFHFFNSSHIPTSGYKYVKRPELIITSEADRSIYQGGIGKLEHDIFCDVDRYHGIRNTVCGKNINLDDWLLSKKKKRPCGPGIMFETVFYFVEHLGVSQVTTLGWDGYPISADKHNHFYSIGETRNNTRDTYMKEHNQAAPFGSQKVYNWLKSHGCELQIAGESHMWCGIPRVSIKTG